MSSDMKTRLRNSGRRVMRAEDFTEADIRQLENTQAPAEARAFDYEMQDHKTSETPEQPQPQNHTHADLVADIRKKIAQADADKRPFLTEEDFDKHFKTRGPRS